LQNGKIQKNQTGFYKGKETSRSGLNRLIPQTSDLVLITHANESGILPYRNDIALILDKRKNYWNGLFQYTLLLETKTIIKNFENNDYLIYVLNRLDSVV